jgi:simple sugar transport system ATP-binding protein
MVHQHFMLIPVLSVAENVILGSETMSNPVFVDRGEASRRIAALAERFGFDLDPDVRVGSLSVGQQQRVEILKALYRDARILVLDEPTAVLTPGETEEIFALLRRLASDGHSIVFISHKLYEVLEVADRITVIRRGHVIGERRPGETTEEELAELMVGREVELTVDRGTSNIGEPVLRVAGLHVADDRHHEVVPDATFEPIGGKVTLMDRDVTGLSPRRMNEAGVGYVPGDRHRFGLILSFPVYDNLVLTSYYRPPFAHGILRDDSAIIESAAAQIERFDIRTPSAQARSSTLSGGNQQKVVVAREFDRQLKLLILDQPTRGLDVGSIEFIHRQIIAKRDAGTAVLLVSAELDEVLEMSDRIVVMYRGRMVAELDGRTADKSEVGLLMATGGQEGAAKPKEELA